MLIVAGSIGSVELSLHIVVLCWPRSMYLDGWVSGLGLWLTSIGDQLKERDRQARIRKIPEAILFDQDIKEARRCVDEANVLFDVPYAFLPRTSPRPKQEGDSDNPVYTMPMIVKPADQKQTPKTSNWREDARKTFDAVTGSFHESMSGQKDRGRTSPSPVNPGGFKVAPPRRGFIHP